MKRTSLGRYVKQVTDFPEPGKHLLFNTLTHGFVEIDDTTKHYLESERDDASNEAKLNGVKKSNLRKLKRMGFLGSTREKEKKQIERYFGRLRSELSTTLQATVLTTFDCNFACTYCVEEGCIKPVYMSEETGRAAADYIINQARETRVPNIYLIFYGGEPLLNPDAIRTVAGKVGAFAKKTHKTFAFSITTNGALLTPQIVDDLVEYGLDGAKITIDGNRQYHNRKRPFRNGSGSFDVILKNVEKVVDKIRIDIGGNFDEENQDSFEELLDILEDRGLRERLDKVSFKAISENPEDRKNIGQFSELECVYGRDETKYASVRLRNMLVERGFPTDPGIGVTICGATLSGVHFTIDPVGKLYKCPAFVGREEFSIGSLENGETSEIPDDLWQRCSRCENVAMCGDGCMYGAYMRYGDPFKLDCRKDYVDYVVQENLKTWYKELTANRTNSELDTVS